MTHPPTGAVDRIPLTHSVRYVVRGLPEVPNQYGPGVLAPSEITLTYRTSPDSQLGRIHAYVAGRLWVDGKEIPLLPGGLYGQHYDDGVGDWPEWLAEEARLHDPAAPTAPADATHGLSVQHADALWDAVAIPGPQTPTFPMQHERVCRAVAEILDELTPAVPAVPVSSPPPDQTAEPVCLCGHPMRQHHEDVCLTECGCQDGREAEAVLDLPDRLEAALTARFTELGNPFSRMRIAFRGPDGWPASKEVGPHDVVLVLRELLAAAPAVLPPPADRAAVNPTERRERYAKAIRDQVRFRFGASVLALAQQGRPIKMTPGEAETAADAVMDVADAEQAELRTQNVRMRHELEVMYGGAFDTLHPAPHADRAAVLLWAADFAEQLMDERYGPDCSYGIGGLDVARELRRLAAEARQPDTETRVGARAECQHCGEPIIYEPWFRDGRGPNPPVWAHINGPRTCGTRPVGWRKDRWPFATPAAAPVQPEADGTEPPAHIGGNADDCPACQAQGLHTIGHPYECPGPETVAGGDRTD